MKKVGFGILKIVLAIMLNGCSLFVKLSAEATIENNTDKTFVCMASYNNSLGTNEQPWELAPGVTKKLTLEGHLTEVDYNVHLKSSNFSIWKKIYMKQLLRNMIGGVHGIH